jgi:recombination protein RecR
MSPGRDRGRPSPQPPPPTPHPAPMKPDHPIEVAVRALSRLPGIGRRTASRLVFHLLNQPREEVAALTRALGALKEQLRFCQRCEGLAEADVCDICADPTRDAGVICVVEQPRDVFVIEQTNTYHGQYHCLHGVLSPIHGVGYAR